MLDSPDYRRLIQDLSYPALLLLQSFQGCTSFTYKEQILQVQTYTCIYDKLDKQYIKCLIINIHQTMIHERDSTQSWKRILFINNSE